MSDDAATFHGDVSVALLGIGLLDDPISGVHSPIDVSDLVPVDGDDVAGHVVVEGETLAASGGLGIDNRFERLVFNLYQLQGVLGDVTVRGDDDRDRGADHADLVQGQGGNFDGLDIVHTLPNLEGSDPGLQIATGPDEQDPGELFGFAGVDAYDAGVGVGTSEEGGMHHAGKLNVIDVAACAGDQLSVLYGLHTGTDAFCGISHVVFL